MICVECAYPGIDELFSKYKSEYIRLKICPHCGKVADKYIEFDSVILFLDLLLLKPQAYRHIAYNETEKLIQNDIVRTQKLAGTASAMSLAMGRYRKIGRFFMVSILFEVYITWAYEEKKRVHSEPIEFVLSQRIYLQYGYFILKVVSEVVGLYFGIYLIFQKCFAWSRRTRSVNLPENRQHGYSTVVLLTTVLFSSSIKLFPILMLIWPYDNSTDSSLYISVLVFFTTVEAVRVVTNKTYVLTVAALVAATLFQQVVLKMLLGVVVSVWSGMPFGAVLLSDYAQLTLKLRLYENLVYKSLEAVTINK